MYTLFQSIVGQHHPSLSLQHHPASLEDRGAQLFNTLHVAVFGIVTAAGLIRGITGFGGSMVMAPPLSLLIGPAPTVVIALALEAVAAITIPPAAVGRVQWKIVGLLTLPSLATVPLGCYLLTNLDAQLTRRLMAGSVVLFSVAMLAGFRYVGHPRPATSIALGGLSGLLLGATSIGAPPVILYLLSGPEPHAVTRAKSHCLYHDSFNSRPDSAVGKRIDHDTSRRGRDRTDNSISHSRMGRQQAVFPT